MSEPTMSPQFLHLSSLLPDCVFLTDRAGRITHASKACKTLFGQPPDQLIGHHFGVLLHPSDRELAGHVLATAGMEEVGPMQLDLRMLRKGEAPFVGRIRVKLTSDGITGVVRDVTADDQEARHLQEFQNYRDRGLALLYLFTVNMASLAPGDDLHRFISQSLMEFTSARFVTMSEFDPALRVLHHRHYQIDAGLMGKVITMLGSRVEDLVTPVSDEMVAEVMSRGWVRLESLYDATFGSIPRPIAAAIQRFVGTDRFFAISFVYGGQLYGTSLIGLMPGEPDPPLEILQAFRHTVAIALRCRALENAGGGG